MEAALPNRQSYLVCIAGGSASGKSTFSDALLRVLESTPAHPVRVERISTDAYFYPVAQLPTFRSPSSGEDTPDCNRPESIDFTRLVTDLAARRSSADCPDVLIVEGLMVLHVPEIRQQADLRLFVELEGEARALRRLIRNLGRNFDPIHNSDARSIANYYLESARVGHERYVEPSRVHADWILRGDGDFERSAALVADLIRARLR